VRGGPLTIVLSWQEDVVETEMAEKVRSALSAEMEPIISRHGSESSLARLDIVV